MVFEKLSTEQSESIINELKYQFKNRISDDDCVTVVDLVELMVNKCNIDSIRQYINDAIKLEWVNYDNDIACL